jgi:tryptophan halogenase
MTKKIAIIGNGTAGCLTASHFNRYSIDTEIEWYYDPNIKPQAVGEGSLIDLPADLNGSLGFSMSDLYSIDGTIKTGIRKIDWADVDSFDENFTFGKHGMHFNAVQLQEFILKKIKQEGKIKIIESNVTHDQIDSNYIIDCSGFPQDYSQHIESEYIPVNSAYVTQCFWDYPKFNHTLTIARPYGWVFGIPLQNRCAIGYMYNSTINSLDEVKADVQNIFDKFNLTHSDTTNHLNFKNYSRQQNFSTRVSYNGNASLFLEPLEATTLAVVNKNKRLAFDLIHNNISTDILNNIYTTMVDEVETIIMLHYFGGSKFNTKFWEFAQDRGSKKIESIKSSAKFIEFLKRSKQNSSTEYSEFGTWEQTTMYQNIKTYNFYSKI